MAKGAGKVNKPHAPPSLLEDEALSADAALSGAASVDDEVLKALGVEVPPEPEPQPPMAGRDAAGKPKPFVRSESGGDDQLASSTTQPRSRKAKAARAAAVPQKIAVRPVIKPEGLMNQPERPAQVYDQKPPDPSELPDLPPPAEEKPRVAYVPAMEYNPEGTEATLAVYAAQSAARAKNRRHKRIVGISVLAILLLFVLLFAVGAIVQHNGSFTVNLSGADKQKGLSLFDSSDMQNGASRLYAQNLGDCADSSYADYADRFFSDIDAVDGSHNTDTYFAYTFYVANNGRGVIDYELKVNILSAARNVDGAIRVAVIDDKTYYGAPDNVRQLNVLAKPEDLEAHPDRPVNESGTPILVDASGKPLSVQDNAQPFHSDSVAYYRRFTDLFNTGPFNKHKFTVMVYLEGGDPDCQNSIKGGEVKFDVQLKVLDYRT